MSTFDVKLTLFVNFSLSRFDPDLLASCGPGNGGASDRQCWSNGRHRNKRKKSVLQRLPRVLEIFIEYIKFKGETLLQLVKSFKVHYI